MAATRPPKGEPMTHHAPPTYLSGSMALALLLVGALIGEAIKWAIQ